MYAPYPTSGPAQEPERIQPPRSVLNAVKLSMPVRPLRYSP